MARVTTNQTISLDGFAEQGVHLDGHDTGEQGELGTAGLLDALDATLEA